MAAVPLPGEIPAVPGAADEVAAAVAVGGPEFLLLPEPEGAVLNHGGPDNVPELVNVARVEKKQLYKNPLSLEDLCIASYLKYLETEIVTYISLTQSKSLLVKGVAKRMLQILKDDINSKLTGVASSVLREKFVSEILSEKFPSVEYCNMYQSDGKDDGDTEMGDEEDMIHKPCPNICCSGAFVQEGMMGVVMSAEVRQLIFTTEKVRSRRQFPCTLEFNVPVVLTHLLGATSGKVSQLERLVFSENFVKEESEAESYKVKRKSLPRIDQTDKQQNFARHFGQGNVYDTSDRRGIAVDLLILFRDIHPKGLQYKKLTELVLKNNIQCKLYSKAQFQFEFLARIGFCCPNLRILDLFGTDTWADCLIALFFKDAFHSLHRYLYFMENEEDECSEYHPHDTTRYCQFCLDQWHPNQVERPYTNNPVIPLLDSVYNHVVKRYPRRSYCILRNCVRVSDLINSKEATVFELVRPKRAPTCQMCAETKGTDEIDPLSPGAGCSGYRGAGGSGGSSAGAGCSGGCSGSSSSTSHAATANINCIKSRLRKVTTSPKLNCSTAAAAPAVGVRHSSCGKYLRCDRLDEACSGPGSGEPRPGINGYRRSTRLSGGSGNGCSSSGTSSAAGGREEKQRSSSKKWVLASRTLEKRMSMPGGRRSVSKSREIINLMDTEDEEEEEGEGGSGAGRLAFHAANAEEQGVMTRAKKRRLDYAEDVAAAARASGSKKCKVERFPMASHGSERRLRGTTNRRSSKGGRGSSESPDKACQDEGGGGGGGSPAGGIAGGLEESLEEDFVISHQQWSRERDERDKRFPATVCNKSGVTGPSKYCDHHDLWFEPEVIKYREIQGWPHLNECVNSLEILNIGGSNVLGEFLPFLFLHTPKLKSLGQWLNTMIYGLEILRDLPGYENYRNFHLQEFSYSSDRNYFCQPYIGFVPESSEFKNVRKEMVRYSSKSAARIGHRQRVHSAKRRQICDDISLMVTSCPNLRKVNLVVHYKNPIMDDTHGQVWEPLLRLNNLVELDLVTMKFDNVRALLTVIGPKLEKLTVECDEEQGSGSEIVHLARHCPNISSLRILLGDKVLRGEMTLHFGQTFFRKLERLTVEGNVHLHGFAFLWGHCQKLKFMKIGLVVSNGLTNTNVLIQDVFTLLFQVNKMVRLEELHIKNLKIRSLAMGLFLLDNLPRLKKASNWFLDLYGEDVVTFNKHVKKLRSKGLVLDYDRL